MKRPVPALTVALGPETMPAVRAQVHRLLPVVVLGLWMAPSLGALGVAVHLALDHHGPHDAGHAEEISELARTATHGHHHDLEAGSDHEHEARVDEPAPAIKPGSSPVGVISSPASARPSLAEPARPEVPPRRPPPGPLFASHCSLLL